LGCFETVGIPPLADVPDVSKAHKSLAALTGGRNHTFLLPAGCYPYLVSSRCWRHAHLFATLPLQHINFTEKPVKDWFRQENYHLKPENYLTKLSRRLSSKPWLLSPTNWLLINCELLLQFPENDSQSQE
jgi:hypothetical protein